MRCHLSFAEARVAHSVWIAPLALVLPLLVPPLPWNHRPTMMARVRRIQTRTMRPPMLPSPFQPRREIPRRKAPHRHLSTHRWSRRCPSRTLLCRHAGDEHPWVGTLDMTCTMTMDIASGLSL